MSRNMREAMTGYLEKPAGHSEKSAVTAVVRARDMLCDLSGPRGWNDTRESWLARGARKAGLSARRARALFYAEPIRLSADEYLAIEKAYQNARDSLETLSALARDADAEAGCAPEGQSGAAVRDGEPASEAECPLPDAFVR
jgi:nucleotide-binding universal stress UspA family protein